MRRATATSDPVRCDRPPQRRDAGPTPDPVRPAPDAGPRDAAATFDLA
jgi:hypothetical protein